MSDKLQLVVVPRLDKLKFIGQVWPTLRLPGGQENAEIRYRTKLELGCYHRVNFLLTLARWVQN